MPIEKIKLSKEKQRDEDIMGKIQILNATTGSMHTKDSTDRYFSIMNDIEEVMSLQSEMFQFSLCFYHKKRSAQQSAGNRVKPFFISVSPVKMVNTFLCW